MPWRPLILGFKFRIRVCDLEATDIMERKCPQCATVTRIPTWQLHALFPAHTGLIEPEGRMTCRKRGRAGARSWRLWRAYPPVRDVAKERQWIHGRPWF